MPPLEIYVHIPFCIKKCAYCDFLSAPSTAEEREAYVAALCREIESCGSRVEYFDVTSIFFGGGTPSLLDGAQMTRIMGKIRKNFQDCWRRRDYCGDESGNRDRGQAGAL